MREKNCRGEKRDGLLLAPSDLLLRQVVLRLGRAGRAFHRDHRPFFEFYSSMYVYIFWKYIYIYDRIIFVLEIFASHYIFYYLYIWSFVFLCWISVYFSCIYLSIPAQPAGIFRWKNYFFIIIYNDIFCGIVAMKFYKIHEKIGLL